MYWHTLQSLTATPPLPLSYASEVTETAGWSVLVQRHPLLVAEAFKALATQQCVFGHPQKKMKISMLPAS